MTDSGMASPAGRVTRVEEVFWASGSFATGMLYNAMALFSLFFMTSILGIEAGLAGAIIFISKLFDGVTDPVMGTISDRTRHRWGPRRPYLLAGAFLLGAGVAVRLLAEESRLLCRPDAWIGGHAAWHLLAAVGLALVAETLTAPDSADASLPSSLQ